ncbi:carbohydrate kinase [Rhizobium sp. C4]|uniref:carbohydrate kinase n=1 Tax=Rhizobium sp. C4 TaxID=1349800 RepID=UPI001E4D4BF1|nr:carbohydrate kinase [Rhizobium sp. C4]MCD2172496.1 winged helix-turn-helix transcriptional regulator [Rhizobium sp. C4]
MEDLGEQERAVLELVKANPFAGQQEIAGMMGLARSTVAAHIVQLMQKGYILGRGYVLPASNRIVCLGGAVLDRQYRSLGPLVEDTSNLVHGSVSSGGVGRNVAENLARLGSEVSFLSVLGNDEAGRFLLAHLRDCGVDTSQSVISETQRTAEYIAILESSGALRHGLSDMAIFDEFTPAVVDRAWSHIGSATFIFADCNLPADTLSALLRRKQGSRARLAIDAVSMTKVARLPKDLTGVDLIFMNMAEAFAFLGEDRDAGSATLDDARNAARMLQSAGAAEAIVSLGAKGTAVSALDGHATYPAAKANPVDLTGAGDAMVAATLHRLIRGDGTMEAARHGILAGALTTECPTTIHPALSAAFLEANMVRMKA